MGYSYIDKVVAFAFSYLLEVIDTSLLLKTPHILDTGIREF